MILNHNTTMHTLQTYKQKHTALDMFETQNIDQTSKLPQNISPTLQQTDQQSAHVGRNHKRVNSLLRNKAMVGFIPTPPWLILLALGLGACLTWGNF